MSLLPSGTKYASCDDRLLPNPLEALFVNGLFDANPTFVGDGLRRSWDVRRTKQCIQYLCYILSTIWLIIKVSFMHR